MSDYNIFGKYISNWMRIFLIFDLANIDHFNDKIKINGMVGIPDGIGPGMDSLS